MCYCRPQAVPHDRSKHSLPALSPSVSVIYETTPVTTADLHDFPFPTRRPSSRQVGVILIGVRIGLGVLIGLNDSLKEALGVGGLVFLIGVGFLLNAMLDRRETSKPGSTSQVEPPR